MQRSRKRLDEEEEKSKNEQLQRNFLQSEKSDSQPSTSAKPVKTKCEINSQSNQFNFQKIPAFNF